MVVGEMAGVRGLVLGILCEGGGLRRQCTNMGKRGEESPVIDGTAGIDGEGEVEMAFVRISEVH